MRIPKWFEIWFWNKGTYRAYISPADVHNATVIAYKAYCKGKKDGMEIVYTCMKYKTAKRRC